MSFPSKNSNQNLHNVDLSGCCVISRYVNQVHLIILIFYQRNGSLSSHLSSLHISTFSAPPWPFVQASLSLKCGFNYLIKMHATDEMSISIIGEVRQGEDGDSNWMDGLVPYVYSCLSFVIVHTSSSSSSHPQRDSHTERAE